MTAGHQWQRSGPGLSSCPMRGADVRHAARPAVCFACVAQRTDDSSLRTHASNSMRLEASATQGSDTAPAGFMRLAIRHHDNGKLMRFARRCCGFSADLYEQ